MCFRWFLLRMFRMKPKALILFVIGILTVASMGCASPYHRDQMALLGGLGGTAIGSEIGRANGNTGLGAGIGALAGTFTGAAIGHRMDEIDARNQALFEAEMGRRFANAATFEDVVAMSNAGLSDQVIVSHIQARGVARVPSAADLISLKQQGVSDAVIRAMQQPPQPVVVRQSAPPPVVVEEYHISRPRRWHPPYWGHRHHPLPLRPYHPRRLHWGVSFSN